MQTLALQKVNIDMILGREKSMVRVETAQKFRLGDAADKLTTIFALF
jgi:hypothetical protein